MFCQSCQKNRATVHQLDVKYNEGSPEVTDLHLCPACAQAKGLNLPGEIPPFPKMVGMLGKALLGMHEALSRPEGPLSSSDSQEGDQSCPSCGWTVQEFKKTSRFGCPEDYNAFPDFVEKILERVQGATEHPLDGSETQLARFQQEMAEAISAEDYEKASSLKKQISSLESELDNAEGLDF